MKTTLHLISCIALLLVTSISSDTTAKESLSELSSFALPSSQLNNQWKTEGSTMQLSSGNILLTESLASQGGMWSKTPISVAEDWEIVLEFSIKGSKTITSEGLMLSLSEKPGSLGNLFGSSQPFKGLAIVFDSHDDDDLKNNPAIAAHLFDGAQTYSHADDGIAHQLAGCIVDYRNRPSNVKAKVVYETTAKRLSVFVDLRGRDKFQRCLVKTGVSLGSPSYYLGLSAENLQVSDRYEIVSLKVFGGHAGAAEEESHIADGEESLEEIDTIVHSKLDTLIKNAENSVDVHQLGQALDEIEANIIRHLNTKLSPLTSQMKRLVERQDSLNAGIDTLRTIEIPKYDTTIMDIQRQVGQVSTVGGRSSEADLLEQIEKRVERTISAEIARLEQEMKTLSFGRGQKNGSGWSFWIMVVLFQVMFAVVVAIQQLDKRRHGKLL